MMKATPILLLLSFVLINFLSLVSSQDTGCYSLSPRNLPAVCAAGAPNGECCVCDPPNTLNCEGCKPTPCPTTTPTKSPTKKPTDPPTKRPTPPPTTTTPKPTPNPTDKPTPVPTTTTTVGTTECTCPPVEVCTPSPLSYTSGKKKKKNKAVGCGVGECDCDEGVAEIRWKYRGVVNGVNIKIYYSESKDFVICEFNNVISGQQVVCNLRGTAPGLVKRGLYEFDKETPFTITGPGGYSCNAQYHTSCSQDIVGVVQPECADFVVSGWQDIGNIDGNDGGDCDDGILEDCECDTDFGGMSTTTSNPVRIPVIIGTNCYCDTTGTPASSPTSPPIDPCAGGGKKKKKKKKCKSKGKKGSKKGKGKKKGQGLGIGDCDCDGGQTELTMLYSGTTTVDVDYFHKDGTKICTTLRVKQGDESVCNVLDYKNGRYSKLGTNTFMELKVAGTNNMLCEMSVHTSCSRDIVGTYGNDGHNCGTMMIVSGWKDANNNNNPGSNDGCDDGLELCACDGTVYVPETPFSKITSNINVKPQTVEVGPSACFCVNESTIALGSQSLSTLVNMANANAISRGYGGCKCTDGVHKLKFVYLPRDPTRLANKVNIEIGYDDQFAELICEFLTVGAGEENTCDLKTSLFQTKYRSFDTKTFVRITDQNTNEVTEGSWATSCSNDIVGWAATDAPDVVITGWSDNSPSRECDDGFYPCACQNCLPYSIQSGASSECAKQAGCYVNEHAQRCDTLAASLYTGSDAPKQIGYLTVIFATFVAVCIATWSTF